MTKKKTRPAPWTMAKKQLELSKEQLDSMFDWTVKNVPINQIGKNKPKRIRSVSKKHAAELVAYRIKRDRFLGDNQFCDGCRWKYNHGQALISEFPACDVHHKRGRGKWLCIESTWMAMCRKCHDFCRDHPKEAMERGWIISRLQK